MPIGKSLTQIKHVCFLVISILLTINIFNSSLLQLRPCVSAPSPQLIRLAGLIATTCNARTRQSCYNDEDGGTFKLRAVGLQEAEEGRSTVGYGVHL